MNIPRKRLWSFWSFLSLRQTLFVGAGLGILLPALAFAYFQIIGKLGSDIENRVRAPLHQYSEVLAHGLGTALWNLDQTYANDLLAAGMRNPDVVDLTVIDEFQVPFVEKHRKHPGAGVVLQDKHAIIYNGIRVGHLVVAASTARVEREFFDDLKKLGLALLAQVACSLAFIWLFFDRRLVRPLEKLQMGARRLALGELDAPLQLQRNDEVGRLSNDLDAMRSNLATLMAEREQKNTALQLELEGRKQVEAELLVSQAKFAGIFDASPIAMTVSHMGGDCTILDVNAAWTRAFARDREVVLGTNGERNGMWKSLEVRSKILARIHSEGEITRMPAWMVRGRDLPDMLCEISGRVLQIGAHPLLILAYEDVTHRYQYEADILRLNATLEQRVTERTQELSDALAQLTTAKDELVRSEKLSALGALVAGIAHELNTPIGNSLTVASTLESHTQAFVDSISKGLTRSRLENFVNANLQGTEILMRSLQHAAELITSFKQVAVDQTSANRRSFDLRTTIAEILMTLGPTLRKSSHKVEHQIPPDILMTSYPGPLGQIITNLVHNALLHAFEGRINGLITIVATTTNPSPGTDGWVEITVRDNGAGIPAEHLSKVFDPFFTTKFGKGGSGLGLNIVYNLATTILGGRVRVESTLGQGTCFVLELPLLME
ncbi:MAG: HAMP domain-containing protein [Rhodoferax sp.]|nr:HAMP domain-containing protein [Rhodoferax sp.]